MPVRFDAKSLFSKWGFSDGDLLDDVLWEGGFGSYEVPVRSHHGFAHLVLVACVRKFLLSALPVAVSVTEIGTIHNPIRADVPPRAFPDPKWGEAEMPDALKGFFVEVADDEILKIAREIAAETGASAWQ